MHKCSKSKRVAAYLWWRIITTRTFSELTKLKRRFLRFCTSATFFYLGKSGKCQALRPLDSVKHLVPHWTCSIEKHCRRNSRPCEVGFPRTTFTFVNTRNHFSNIALLLVERGNLPCNCGRSCLQCVGRAGQVVERGFQLDPSSLPTADERRRLTPAIRLCCQFEAECDNKGNHY